MRFVGGGGIRAVSLERLVSAVEGVVVAISARLEGISARSSLVAGSVVGRRARNLHALKIGDGAVIDRAYSVLVSNHGHILILRGSF